MRPPNWQMLLQVNTRKLRDLSNRILEQTDESERFKLVCRCDALLDERARLNPKPADAAIDSADSGAPRAA